MVQRAESGKARRRRKLREMRTLLERAAFSLRPERSSQCQACGELFDACEPDCIAGDIRAWLRDNREGTSE